jgi:hypothetical protein
MTPESRIVEPEQTSIARQPLDKHIPAATNTHATIEEPVSKQRIGKSNRGIEWVPGVLSPGL